MTLDEKTRQRLKQAVEAAGLPMSSVSLKAGLRSSAVWEMIHRGQGGEERLKRILHALGLDENWLSAEPDTREQASSADEIAALRPGDRPARRKHKLYEEQALTRAFLAAFALAGIGEEEARNFVRLALKAAARHQSEPDKSS